METQFTKGEWKVETSEHIGCVKVSFGDFKGGIECWAHHGDTHTRKEAEANAKLIAAAPELLEALTQIIPYASEWINDNHAVMQNAKQAIKKATE